jgi:hypothetical protein
MRKQIQQWGLAVVLAAGFGISGHSQPPDLQTTPSLDQTNTAALWQQFATMQQTLQTNRTIQDEELRQLLAQMNSAPAAQKLDAVVALVNKLVEERLAADQWKEALKTRLLQALTEIGSNGTNGMPATNQTVLPTIPPGAAPTVPQNPPATTPPSTQPTTPQSSAPAPGGNGPPALPGR